MVGPTIQISRGVAQSTPSTSVAIVAHRLDSGNDGGTFTSGARQTRPINLKVSDPDSIVSLSASVANGDDDQFILEAGSYEVIVVATAFQVGRNILFLRNVTDSSDVDQSLNNETNNTFNAPTILTTAFSISAQKTFQVQHYCETTKADNGLGAANSFSGVDETYLQIMIRKL